MSKIILPYQAKIDWRFPITRGLVFDGHPFKGAPVDLVHNLKGVYTDTTVGVRRYGKAALHTASATTKQVFTNVPGIGSFPYMTVEVLTQMTGGGNSNVGGLFALHDKVNSSTWFGVANDTYSGGWGLRLNTFYPAREKVWSIAYPTLNVFSHYVFIYDHTNKNNAPEVIKNGVYVGTPSDRFDQAWTKTIVADTITIGSGWGGQIAYARVWNRLLKRREASQLYANPYHFYKKMPRHIGKSLNRWKLYAEEGLLLST